MNKNHSAQLKHFKIDFDEDTNEYSFTCPYCGKKQTLPDDVSCEHYLFGYETVNSMPIGMDNRLYQAISGKLENHRTKGPEAFRELWMGEFCPGEIEDPDEYDSLREECISEYLENIISLDDVLWFMDRLPQYKGYKENCTLFTVEDGEGEETEFLFF